jgi:predicted metalloprotease with PDZ domain
VTPYDLEALLRDRIHSTAAHAPLGGIERGGWKLVYDDKPNAFIHAGEVLGKDFSVYFSLGFVVKESGELQDVVPNSPAYLAGIGPGMKLVAVNEKKWSKAGLKDALRAAQENDQPIELLIENAKVFKTYSVSYHDGEKNPHLVRSDGADILGEILKPLTK